MCVVMRASKVIMITLTAIGVAFVTASLQAEVVPTDISGRFAVAPLRLNISAAAEASSLQISNKSAGDEVVQVRVFSWAQISGKDQYALSPDFIVFPSITKIHSGRTQLVRILRREKSNSYGENRYRVVIDQLPTKNVDLGQAAQTRLQISIPMFSGTETAKPAKIYARVHNNTLELSNAGQQTAQISRLTLTSASGQEIPVLLQGQRYIHGGSTIAYNLGPFNCSSVILTDVKMKADQAESSVAVEQICS